MAKRLNGRGVATRAVQLVCEWGFGEAGLHRLEAATLTDNVASQTVLTRNRFSEIGLCRNYLEIAGKWRDHLLFHARWRISDPDRPCGCTPRRPATAASRRFG